MQSLCKYENCANPIRRIGLCSTHASQHYRDRGKARALAYLGGDCSKCSSIEGLEFDHIDPTNVSFRISQRYDASWIILKAELDKCQLLCHTCHWIKTCKESARTYYFTMPHGTANAYGNHGCRCDICRSAWAAYTRKKRGN